MHEHETKRMIMNTALQLFKRQGYDQVTVQNICDACGITKTTFYYHLSSKAEIVSDYYKPVTTLLAQKMAGVLAAGNYWEQFMAIFYQLVDTSEEIGYDLLGQLFIMNIKEDQGTFDLDYNLTETAVVLIEHAQKVGQIRNQSPALSLYYAASHAFEGYDLLWCIKKRKYDRKRVLRKAFEDIFDVEPTLRKVPLYEAFDTTQNNAKAPRA